MASKKFLIFHEAREFSRSLEFTDKDNSIKALGLGWVVTWDEEQRLDNSQKKAQADKYAALVKSYTRRKESAKKSSLDKTQSPTAVSGNESDWQELYQQNKQLKVEINKQNEDFCIIESRMNNQIKLLEAKKVKLSNELKDQDSERRFHAEKLLKQSIDSTAELTKIKQLELDKKLSEIKLREKAFQLTEKISQDKLNIMNQRVYQIKKDFSQRLEILQAIEETYIKKFGLLKVKKTEKEVIENHICLRCDGGGSAAKNCSSCGGTGIFKDIKKILKYEADW